MSCPPRSHRLRPNSLAFEKLEDKVLLAADTLVKFEVETLDAALNPVERVEVGDSFLLRIRAKDVRVPVMQNSNSVFAAFADLNFDGSLVARAGDLVYSDVYPHVRSGDLTENGAWDEVGAVNDAFATGVADPTLIFEVEMLANAVGEVVFATNPADLLPSHDVLLQGLDEPIPQSQIDYGFKRLQIGDASPSPWQNPDNPADVNGDGRVDQIDVDVISEALSGSSGEIALSESDFASGQAPFVDVDGNQSLNSIDQALVLAQLPNEGASPITPVKPLPPTTNPHKPDFEQLLETSLEVVNVRTGEVNPATMLEGDLLRVSLIVNDAEELHDQFAAFLTLLVADVDVDETQLRELEQSVVERPRELHSPSLLFQAVSPGETEIKLVPNERFAGLNIARKLGENQSRFEEHLASLTYGVEILPNEERPIATEDSYSLAALNLDSARSAYQHLQENDLSVLSVDAEEGVLANDDFGADSADSARVFLTSGPKSGSFALEENGSFQYQSSLSHVVSDSFEYVVITDSGVSESITVAIEGASLPLVDFTFTASNEDGEPLAEVAIGETFFIEVTAFAAEQIGFSRYNALNLELGYNSEVVEKTGGQETSSRFDREHLSLGQDDAGNLTLETEIQRPNVETGDGLIEAAVSGFSTKKVVGQEETLFRVQVQAKTAGTLDLAPVISSLGFYPAQPQVTDEGEFIPEVVPEAAINIITDNVRVISSAWQNQDNPLDADGNGVVTPFDVLVGVNRINLHGSVLPANRPRAQATGGEGEQTMDMDNFFYDTNGDGVLSSIDILERVNYLNGVSGVQAEGENTDVADLDSAAAADQYFGDGTITDAFNWQEDWQRRRVRS